MSEIEETNYKLDFIAKEMIKKFIQAKSHNPEYTKKTIECLDSKTTKIDDTDILKEDASDGFNVRTGGGYHKEQKKVFIPKEEIQKILSQKDKSKSIKNIMSTLPVVIHEYGHLLSAEVAKGELTEFSIEEGYADLFAASVIDYAIKNNFELLEGLDINGLEIEDWKQNKLDLESRNEGEGFITSGYVGEDEEVFGITEILKQTENKDVEAMLEYLVGDKENWREIVQNVFGEKFASSTQKRKILLDTVVERKLPIRYDSKSNVYNQRQKVTKSYERQQQIEQVLLQDGSGMNSQNANKIMEIIGDEKDNSGDWYRNINFSIVKQYISQCETLEDLEKVKSSSLKTSILNKAIEIEQKESGQTLLSGKKLFDLIKRFDAPIQMAHSVRVLEGIKKEEIKQYSVEELMKFTNPRLSRVNEGNTEQRLKDIFDHLSEQELSYSQRLELERAKLVVETSTRPVYSQAKCLSNCIKILSDEKEEKNSQEEDKQMDLLETIEEKLNDYDENTEKNSSENVEELRKTLFDLSEHYQENSFWSVYYDRIKDIGNKIIGKEQDKSFNKESFKEVYERQAIEPNFVSEMTKDEPRDRENQEKMSESERQ